MANVGKDVILCRQVWQVHWLYNFNVLRLYCLTTK